MQPGRQQRRHLPAGPRRHLAVETVKQTRSPCLNRRICENSLDGCEIAQKRLRRKTCKCIRLLLHFCHSAITSGIHLSRSLCVRIVVAMRAYLLNLQHQRA